MDTAVGGGPLFNDAAAQARINAQMVSLEQVPGDHIATGSEAVTYAGLLSKVVDLGPSFSVINQEVKCALNQGLLGIQAYATQHYEQAGLELVLSHNQFQQLPKVELKCIANHFLGGGPGAPTPVYSPCFDSFRVTDTVSAVTDTYYIYAVGTNGAWCTLVRSTFTSKNIPTQAIVY